MKRQILLLFVSAMLLGCATVTTDRYHAHIRWTSYGIPHVKADDWGSLGYGFAYATAPENGGLAPVLFSLFEGPD